MKKLSIVFVSLLVMACGSVSADPLKHTFYYNSSFGHDQLCFEEILVESADLGATTTVYASNMQVPDLGGPSLFVATSEQLAGNKVKVTLTTPWSVTLDLMLEGYGVYEDCFDRSVFFHKTGKRTYTTVDSFIMEPLDLIRTELTSIVDDRVMSKGFSNQGESGISCIATGVAGFCN